MQTQVKTLRPRGFTLVELMVAMAITVIIVAVLVPITAIATDTWNRSRSELRASRQAKAMIGQMAKDFETLVTRRGTGGEWLSAINTGVTVGGAKIESSNSCDFLFFSGSSERYNGELGTAADLGGDVSGIAYRLYFKDPIDPSGTAYQTFVFHRMLVNPDLTFKDLLGKDDLAAAFRPYLTGMDKGEYFICENIYQYSVTFHVQATHVTQASGSTPAKSSVVNVPITVGKSDSQTLAKSFKLNSTGIVTTAQPTIATTDEIKAGRIVAIEISITVLSDLGVDQLRLRNFASDEEKSKFLIRNSFNYSKRIQVPGM